MLPRSDIHWNTITFVICSLIVAFGTPDFVQRVGEPSAQSDPIADPVSALVYATFTDKDFRLGLNAAQTSLAAIANMAGATLKR